MSRFSAPSATPSGPPPSPVHDNFEGPEGTSDFDRPDEVEAVFGADIHLREPPGLAHHAADARFTEASEQADEAMSHTDS